MKSGGTSNSNFQRHLLSLLDNDVDDANSAIAGAARNYRPARRRRRRAVFNF